MTEPVRPDLDALREDASGAWGEIAADYILRLERLLDEASTYAWPTDRDLAARIAAALSSTEAETTPPGIPEPDVIDPPLSSTDDATGAQEAAAGEGERCTTFRGGMRVNTAIGLDAERPRCVTCGLTEANHRTEGNGT